MMPAREPVNQLARQPTTRETAEHSYHRRQTYTGYRIRSYYGNIRLRAIAEKDGRDKETIIST